MINTCKEKTCSKEFESPSKKKYCSNTCSSRAYYRENPEKCKALTKNWEKRNPDKVLARKRAYRRREKEKESDRVAYAYTKFKKKQSLLKALV